MSIQRVLAELATRYPAEDKMVPDLERIRLLMDLLGSPQKAYPSIHLTGTNGKSSTARMIDALLQGFGLRPGRYTSPHLDSITERITIDGQPLPLDPDGTTTVTAPTTPGPHTVIVTVTDGFDTDTTTTTFNVVDPSDTVAPTVQIHSPREAATADLLVITSPQDVVASVSDDRLRRWSLQLFERGAPGSEGILLASGTTNVSNAEVGRIDPTLLMNGQYSLVLKGEDASGNVAQDIVAVSIEGAMKLGHFSITFEDLNLPVSGIPVTVSRTYDTRTRHRNLDFGHGWSLSYQNVRVHESRRPGFGWEFKVYPSGPLGLIPNYCMESALGNVVSITLADGKVEKFRPKAVPECNKVLPLVDVSLVFVPVSGTHGQLKAIDDTSGRLMNGSIAPLDAHPRVEVIA